MVPKTSSPQFDIEALDPKRHDRTRFSCGVPRLDNFLKRSARKQQKGDFSRVYVALGIETSSVIGFYAINAHSITGDALPKELTKNAPSHGGIPAAYLSMIGVDQSAQGKGLGSILMADALKRIARAADEIGIALVVLDAIDDGCEDALEKRMAFYERIGFRSLPSAPTRMIMSVAAIRQTLAAEG